MLQRYLIRLDDACPTMNKERWDRMESILDKYDVKPMVGIVPDCKDEMLMVDDYDSNFWRKAYDWQAKGWAIALHGYDHCYISDKGMEGLNPLWKRSEFAGVPIDIQCEKIKRGLAIIKEHGLEPKYFFAPSHTFDMNTLLTLKKESNIRAISDTIAIKPYQMNDFIIIPQLGGHCTRMLLPGVWTFCLHPNMMTEANFIQTESFLKRYQRNFVSFADLNLSNLRGKDIFSKILSKCYFLYRSFRGIS